VEVPLKRHSRLAAPLVTLLLVSLYLLTGVALAETVFVQSKTAKLRSGKTSLDSVVADLKFGESLEVLSKEGNWLVVQTARGAKGWIFAGKTTPTKPAGSEDDVLAKLGKSFRRTEAGDVTASAGARGLDKVSEGYANRAGITQQHRDAIDHMAGYRISDQDVEDFLKQGRLGEYAQ
jgi:SH3 domain-containing protein